jgi:hypothetical protein
MRKCTQPCLSLTFPSSQATISLYFLESSTTRPIYAPQSSVSSNYQLTGCLSKTLPLCSYVLESSTIRSILIQYIATIMHLFDPLHVVYTVQYHLPCNFVSLTQPVTFSITRIYGLTCKMMNLCHHVPFYHYLVEHTYFPVPNHLTYLGHANLLLLVLLQIFHF